MKLLPSLLLSVFLILWNDMKSQDVGYKEHQCVLQNSEVEAVPENFSFKNDCPHRTVRVNVHFILREDGTGNFTEKGTELDQWFSGYDYANVLIKNMNFWQSYNPQSLLPPGNNIPALDKNYTYVLDGVYFNRSDLLFENPTWSQLHNQFGVNKTEVINIYYLGRDDFMTGVTDDGDPSNDGDENIVGGYVISTANQNINKLVVMENRYIRYLRYLHVKGYSGWGTDFLDATGGLTEIHELAHNLGLRHTVKGATEIGTNNPVVWVNQNHDDGCDDTPTAWYLVNDLGLSNPYCGYVGCSKRFCSNNLMDDSGCNSLTPDQLNRIHYYLRTGLKTFTAKYAIDQTPNLTICNFNGLPQIAYYGKKVNLGGCQNTISKDQTSIYFTDETVIYDNFEVVAGGSFFEIASSSKCW